MATEKIKQPSESRLYSFNFENLLETGETITSVASVTQTNLGKVSGSGNLTLGSETFSDSSVQLRISGGTEWESYKVTVLVNTSLNNILELDGILRIREV